MTISKHGAKSQGKSIGFAHEIAVHPIALQKDGFSGLPGIKEKIV
jgi:hypothetical protein